MSLAILPNSNNIVSGSGDSNIKIWQSESPYECIANLTGHTASINALAILPNSNIVSASADSTIKIWNSSFFYLIANLTGHTDIVKAIAILSSSSSSTNSLIISGSSDQTIKIWQSESPYYLVHTLYGHTKSVNALSILNNNDIVSGAEDGTLKVWNSTSFQLKANILSPIAPGVTNNGHIGSLAILPNNMIFSGIVKGDIGYIEIWKIEKFQIQTEWKSFDIDHDNYVKVLKILDDSYVICGDYDANIKILNSTNFRLIYTLNGHNASIRSLAILSNKNKIVSGSYDKTIKIWQSQSPYECEATLYGHTDYVLALAILPNSNIVLGLTDGRPRALKKDCKMEHLKAAR